MTVDRLYEQRFFSFCLLLQLVTDSIRIYDHGSPRYRSKI